MNGRAIVGWTVAALLAITAGILYFGVEWVEHTVDAGYSDAARRNHFLAAEMFLEQHGIDTETVSGMSLLDDLPSTDDLIVLSASREYLSERRRNALRQWIESGGLMLVIAHSLYDYESEDSDDLFLDELGIFLLDPEQAPDTELDEEVVDDEQSAAADGESDSESSSKPPSESEQGEGVDNENEGNKDEEAGDATDTAGEDGLEVVEVGGEEDEGEASRTLQDLLTPLVRNDSCIAASEAEEVSTLSGNSIQLELDGPYELGVYDENLEEAYFSETAQLLSMDIGEGHVVALTSLRPFSNRRIHCLDHAYFIHYLAEGVGKVWWLHDPEVPSLAGLVWRFMPVTSVGLFALIVLWVASASLRFGTLAGIENAPRRELREHLEASVSFFYRRGGFMRLFARLRADLERGGPALDDTSQFERWAERAGVTIEEARAVFEETPPRNRRRILKRVQTMLRLRRTL